MTLAILCHIHWLEGRAIDEGGYFRRFVADFFWLESVASDYPVEKWIVGDLDVSCLQRLICSSDN